MERLEQKKIILPFIISSFLLIIAAWAFLVWEDTRIQPFDVASVPIASPAEKYEFALETVESAAMIRIKGWIIERHHETLPVEIDVVLREEETGKGFLLPTVLTFRDDVTAEMDDGTNYDWAGFEVLIPARAPIDLAKRSYTILLRVKIQGKERLIDTETALERDQR